MNTFRAILPCAGTAGGVAPHACAAGRPIVVCGRPERGGEARRGTCLAAPSAAASAITNLNPVERGFSRAICPDAFFDGRRLAASGIAADKSGKLQVQPPISFLGRARFQLRQKSLRCAADGFHDPISFRDAPAFQRQNITERIPHDAKSGTRPRNLTARQGNAY